MKKILTLAAAALALSAFAAKPKYVFLFIGDGMATPQRMIADEYSRRAGRGPLAMNTLPHHSTVRTASASSLVTDSAAAATAIACGVKTCNGAVGMDPSWKAVGSCAEAAKSAGRKVGIITTVTITHATPAGFYAHRRNRGETYAIAVDLADSGFDFFAGGGLDTHLGKSKSFKEFGKCGEAYGYAERQGYRIVRSLDEFKALKPSDGKILTCFRNDALTVTIDRGEDCREPTIAEMVAKAAEMLEGPDGFFIMAEGGKIDWAGHANDAATNLRDVLALDDAVKVALEFLERHPDETLVVVTGDHETGGMSMGFSRTGYALYMDRLANQTVSVGAFDEKVKDAFKADPDLAFDGLKTLVEKSFGFKFEGDAKSDPMVLDSAELAEIKSACAHDAEFHKSKIEENSKYDGEKRYLLGSVCTRIISRKSGIGWSSGAHTAMPVLTTAKGAGAESFTGFYENTDISKKIISLL